MAQHRVGAWGKVHLGDGAELQGTKARSISGVLLTECLSLGIWFAKMSDGLFSFHFLIPICSPSVYGQYVWHDFMKMMYFLCSYFSLVGRISLSKKAIPINTHIVTSFSELSLTSNSTLCNCRPPTLMKLYKLSSCTLPTGLAHHLPHFPTENVQGAQSWDESRHQTSKPKDATTAEAERPVLPALSVTLVTPDGIAGMQCLCYAVGALSAWQVTG